MMEHELPTVSIPSQYEHTGRSNSERNAEHVLKVLQDAQRSDGGLHLVHAVWACSTVTGRSLNKMWTLVVTPLRVLLVRNNGYSHTDASLLRVSRVAVWRHDGQENNSRFTLGKYQLVIDFAGPRTEADSKSDTGDSASATIIPSLLVGENTVQPRSSLSEVELAAGDGRDGGASLILDIICRARAQLLVRRGSSEDPNGGDTAAQLGPVKREIVDPSSQVVPLLHPHPDDSAQDCCTVL